MKWTKSKRFTGIYIYNMENGDKSYQVRYHDCITSKWTSKSIGRKSQGITELYANNKRNEYINMLKHGEDPFANRKKKAELRFSIVANSYLESLVALGKKDIYNPKNRYEKYLKDELGSKGIHQITKAYLLSLKEKILKTSSAFNNTNFLIPFYPSLTKYGDCSLMAERTVVVRKTRVRFPSFAYQKVIK